MADGGEDSQRALVEAGVAELVSGALRDVDQRGLGRGVEFRSLGLDSQSIIALIAAVEREFGIQFGLDTPPEAFMSIAQLSDEVVKLRTTLDLSS